MGSEQPAAATPFVHSPYQLALRYPSYQAVLNAREHIWVILRPSSCPWTDSEIDNHLLWVGDLQQWVSESQQAQLCAHWNKFWTALWQFRSECVHPAWEEKPFLQHLPNHYACSWCGLIQVHAPPP